MFKLVLYVSALLVIFGCSSGPKVFEKNSPNNQASNTQVTLSYIKSYLLLGNIEKAEQLFRTIETPEKNAHAMLLLAELQAAKSNSIDAQTAFISALNDQQYNHPLNKSNVTNNLVDYFCSERKWPALQGYASALVTSGVNNNQLPSSVALQLKNKTLTQIGLCFFNGQQLEQADQLLQQIDLTTNVNPEVHLALARIAIEQNQMAAAQTSMERYEATKSQIDAKMLWTAFEVYQALDQPDIAERTGKYLYSLFPHSEYTRKYILAKKRSERLKRQQKAQELLSVNDLEPLEYEKENSTEAKAVKKQEEQNQLLPEPEFSIHIIKKGETLYQLSKRYDVSIPELQSLNPTLEIDNISVGTKIRITRTR